MVGIFSDVSNCYSQSRFNRIIDCEHQTMNILISVLPMSDGYILTIGSGDVEGYGSNRCSMLVKTDTEGNVLYRNFICDSTFDVYEGSLSVCSPFYTETGTYKSVFSIGPGIQLFSYEFNDSLQFLDMVRINADSTYRIDMLCNIYTEDNIYIGGAYGNFREYLAKYDIGGNVIAEAERIDHVAIYNLILQTNGNIITVGIKTHNNHNWVVQKLDPSLNLVWQKTYGRTDMVNGVQIFIAPSPDSCYVMSGIYPVCYADRYEYETCDATCIRKIDDNGNLLWEKVIKNYGPEPLFYLNDESYDLYVDDNGYIYVASTIMYNNFSRTGALTKLSPQGDIMYIRHYEPTGRGEHQSAITYLNSVKPTPDGGLIMGGYTYDSYYTPTDFGDYFQQPWLVKTDMDGLDGLCYTELPELDFDIFIPDTVCNLDSIDCVVNISGPSAPYRLDFSTGQVIDSIYYPDTYVPYDFGIDRPISSEYLYEYSDYITEATLKKNTTWEDIIARHYNIRTPRDPGEHQLAITLSDYYGNTKTIYKDIYVNPCHDLAVDENDNIMLSVYPNPATECINIAGENIAEIQICNLLGEVVYYNGSVVPRRDTTNVISTENMPAGSYFVRVRMTDGKVVTKKIIVL